ncbi:hypothetical protein KY285_035575 [Solanum tuberosum]|nr:hypothetical protein KY285_035575 [Solanum tuberosum]
MSGSDSESIVGVECRDWILVQNLDLIGESRFESLILNRELGLGLDLEVEVGFCVGCQHWVWRSGSSVESNLGLKVESMAGCQVEFKVECWDCVSSWKSGHESRVKVED